MKFIYSSIYKKNWMMILGFLILDFKSSYRMGIEITGMALLGEVEELCFEVVGEKV